MKIPTTEEFVKSIAEKAFDEYEYEGKTLRQWVEILKDYDDKQTTLQRIVERLEEASFWTEPDDECDDSWEAVWLDKAIEIVKEEGLK